MTERAPAVLTAATAAALERPVGRRHHEFLAGVRSSAAFDEPTVRGDLVGSVDGDVETFDLPVGLDPDTQFARCAFGPWGGGDAGDVERPADQRWKKEGNC